MYFKNTVPTINLGDWYDTQFPTVGSTSSEVDIPITLNCLAGTNIKATVVGTSGVINASQGHIGLSGTDKATGIAIQLVDANKNPIPLGSKQTIKVTSQQASISLVGKRATLKLPIK
ncbi:fimbrial protein [Providencia rettgeri]|nr:fimbrial protein [Providencia rettgeri]